MLIMISGLRLVVAALCGTAAALSLAPLYLWPLMIPAYSGLLWLLNTAKGWRGALLLGWVFGLAYFLVGLHWVGQAFLVDAENFAWMMPFAVSALSAGLALFAALAAGATRRLSQPGLSRLFAFALFWGLTEWLRGSILTG
nr:apolipoprotein N-acyltransferase [Alphaproteobacteria bacterium]